MAHSHSNNGSQRVSKQEADSDESQRTSSRTIRKNNNSTLREVLHPAPSPCSQKNLITLSSTSSLDNGVALSCVVPDHLTPGELQRLTSEQINTLVDAMLDPEVEKDFVPQV